MMFLPTGSSRTRVYYYFIYDSLEYLISQLICKLQKINNLDHIFPVFNSKNEAEEKLSVDYQNQDYFTYYYLVGTDWFACKNGQSTKIDRKIRYTYYILRNCIASATIHMCFWIRKKKIILQDNARGTRAEDPQAYACGQDPAQARGRIRLGDPTFAPDGFDCIKKTLLLEKDHIFTNP
jgi:hypothetical protein